MAESVADAGWEITANQVAPVPKPSTCAMMILGGAAISVRLPYLSSAAAQQRDRLGGGLCCLGKQKARPGSRQAELLATTAPISSGDESWSARVNAATPKQFPLNIRRVAFPDR